MEKHPDSDAESDDTIRQRFPGTTLETVAVPERNQVPATLPKAFLKYMNTSGKLSAYHALQSSDLECIGAVHAMLRHLIDLVSIIPDSA